MKLRAALGVSIADGLAAIGDALAWTERTDGRWVIAELLRIKGERLMLEGAPGAAAAAEDLFQQALDWACRQGALSRELRAATSLARLCRQAGPSRRGEGAPLAGLRPLHRRSRHGRSESGKSAPRWP